MLSIALQKNSESHEFRTHQTDDCVVVGRESVGKSQLVASLTRTSAIATNYRGSTVTVERYRGRERTYVDTPGILRRSDTQTTALALSALEISDTVILVVQATTLDEDLREMLPLVVGKRGIVVVTYWDKVETSDGAISAIEKLSHDAGVSFVPVDARNLTAENREGIEKALLNAGSFTKAALTKFAGWRIEPKPGVLDHRFLGPVVAIFLLLLPALATVFGANRVAEFLNPIVSTYVEVAIAYVNDHFHPWLQAILALICFAIAITAFVPGWLKHRRILPAAFGGCGIALISLAAFAMEGQCCASCVSPGIESKEPHAAAQTACEDGCCEACSQDAGVAQFQPDPRREIHSDFPQNRWVNFLSSITPWLTPIGALTLVFAHLLNRRFAGSCACCPHPTSGRA